MEEMESGSAANIINWVAELNTIMMAMPTRIIMLDELLPKDANSRIAKQGIIAKTNALTIIPHWSLPGIKEKP